MKKFKNIVINTCLIALLLVGVLLLFNKPLQAYFIARASDQVMDVDAETIATNQEADASFDFDAIEELTLTDILALQSMKSYVPVIGQIAVPAVNLHLPIAKGLSETALATGAGTMKEQQQLGEGNYALASHNLEGTDVLFSPLHQAAVGDVIYITDFTSVYTYEITLAQVVDPMAVYVIDDVPNEKLLTLITCAFDGQERLHVKATFIDETPMEQATDEMLAAFNCAQTHK